MYLCDKRIDMVPEVLSSNLCSLRANEDRLAFSGIWEMTKLVYTFYTHDELCTLTHLHYTVHQLQDLTFTPREFITHILVHTNLLQSY